MTLRSNLEKQTKSNRILSLSSNGVEGIAELGILAEIEARTGKSVSELFPVITGSGIGGLIAALLTVPKSQGSTIAKYSAKESLEIFKEISVNIFEYYEYRGMKPEFKHRYRQKALKELLDKYIGNTHLGDATSRLIIPATDLNTNAKDAKISEGYNLVDSNNHSDLKLQDILLTTTAAPIHVNSAQYLASEALKKIQDKQYSNSKTENIESAYNVVVTLNSDKETRTNKEIFHTINNTITGAQNQQKLSDRQLNSQSNSAVELMENILNQGDTYSEIVLPVGNYTEQTNNATNKNILALEEISHQYIIKHDKELTQLCQILLGNLPRSQQVAATLDTQERDEGYESDVDIALEMQERDEGYDGDIDIALEKQVKKKINNQEVNNLVQSRKKVLPPENAADKSQQNKLQEIFTGWEFTQGKTGGVNDAGEYGGVYKSTDSTKLAMIKKEENTSKNISEYLGSMLFNSVSKGNGAKVSIIVPKMLEKELGSSIKNHNWDQEVYVKSEFFNNYSGDMYVDMDRYMSESKKPSRWFRKDGGRPLFMGSRNKLHGTLENAFKELDYQGFEDIMPASLLIGDFDIHLGNIGIIRDDNNELKPRMVRIDFAGSLRKLTDKIYPHSRLRHLPGFGPTNHYREFPSHLRRNNEALGIKLLESSKIDLSETIDSSFKEISKYYSKDAIISFAKASLPKQFAKRENTEISINEIKEAFKSMISRRQESLQEYGMEVLLSTLVKKIANAPYYEIDRHKLKALITDNMKYFVDRFIGVDKVTVKVSNKSLRGIFLVKKGVEKMLGQEISSILKEVIKEEKKSKLLLNQSEVSNNKAYTKKQDNINSAQAKFEHATTSHNLLDSSNRRQDMYIVNNVAASTQSNEYGTLTRIVRNEILKKQRDQLNLYLSKYVELAQFVKDDKSFQYFLSNLNTGNKKLVDKALTNAKVKAELEHIELSGYQKIHSAFKDSCQDIRWGNTINSNTGLQRSQIIKDGEHEVCTLIETTNNAASTTLSKQDGTTITVNKYRTISFPKIINYPVSSIDLAIVALDEMGNRPDESHAVYFTAHYAAGADGKTILTEVSTPIPLKFQGDGKDAIGYVEHNGKIYTMPVTRGKYEEMMVEVAKNKGQGLNLSQTIEPKAYDIAKVASMVNNRSLESEDYHKERLVHHSNPSLDSEKQTDESLNITQTNDLPYQSMERIAQVIGQNLKKVKKVKKYNKSINYYSKANNIQKKSNNYVRT